MPESDRQPWEASDGEGKRAFECLEDYLRQGPGRSLEATARAIGESASLMRKLSAKWGWVERARAYDDHMAGIRQAEVDRQAAERAAQWERRRLAYADQVWGLAGLMIERAQEMLKMPLTRRRVGKGGETIIEPARWTMSAAAQIAKVACDLKRSAIDEATEPDQFDPDTATPEECKAYVERVLNRKKAVQKLLDRSGSQTTPE